MILIIFNTSKNTLQSLCPTWHPCEASPLILGKFLVKMDGLYSRQYSNAHLILCSSKCQLYFTCSVSYIVYLFICNTIVYSCIPYFMYTINFNLANIIYPYIWSNWIPSFLLYKIPVNVGYFLLLLVFSLVSLTKIIHITYIMISVTLIF